MNPEEATALSAALLDRIVSAAVEARGTMFGNGAVKPGVTLNVKDAGPASGRYQVTKVEHFYDSERGFMTSFVAGDRRPTSLVDVLGNGDGREGAFRHSGVVVGEVANINDPNKSGRVKVRYPGLSPGEQSEWARLLTIGGGKDRGALFIPEVGDEVLVAFEGGDPRQPVVLGGLFGDKSTIPEWDVKGGIVNSRRMTSRRGHYIEFGDGDTDPTQLIALALAGANHKFQMSKERVDLEVPDGVPIAIKAGTSAQISIDKQGNILIKGMSIKLEATESVSIKGATVKIEGTGSLSLETDGSAALKGTNVDVTGNAMTTIKGNAGVAIN